MKIFRFIRRDRGLTVVEVLVVIVIAMGLLLFLFSTDLLEPVRDRGRSRIECVNNLKQAGLAFRIWAGDQTTTFPMARSTTNGGSMEFTSGPNAFRHFQAMSNELSTPRTAFCPAETDSGRAIATNFFDFNNSNVSYFVGIVSNDNIPTLILSGDHNIINGMSVKNGLLELTTNNPSRWTSEMHNKVGNILLADGSVQMVTISGLRQTVANTGVDTNLLQMPILGP